MTVRYYSIKSLLMQLKDSHFSIWCVHWWNHTRWFTQYVKQSRESWLSKITVWPTFEQSRSSVCWYRSNKKVIADLFDYLIIYNLSVELQMYYIPHIYWPFSGKHFPTLMNTRICRATIKHWLWIAI